MEPVKYFTVSEAAARIDCLPREISDLFYLRKLDVSRCPLVGGRRLIPADYIPEISRIVSQARSRRQESPPGTQTD